MLNRWKNTALGNVGENKKILEIFERNGYKLKVDATT